MSHRDADDEEVRAWAALTQIEENLIRRDLTPAQRAKLIAKRKAAYDRSGAGRSFANLVPVSRADNYREEFHPLQAPRAQFHTFLKVAAGPDRLLFVWQFLASL